MATYLLSNLIARTVPMHAVRLRALMAAVQSVLSADVTATVTSIGRHLAGRVFAKHKIKRIDRLLSNLHLHQERKDIYTALTQCILFGLKEPIIAVDWSPLCADQTWQLLRASIPVGGRSLTLYEEVHPQPKLGNRKVQQDFLLSLKKMLPVGCIPIIVADAGFKTPFYRFIEEKLAWHWVGRIRGRDLICSADETEKWFGAKSLYTKAAQAAQYLGEILRVKSARLKSLIVMIKEEKKLRFNLTLKGKKRRSKKDKTHANAAKEPWLLVYGQSLKERAPEQIENRTGSGLALRHLSAARSLALSMLALRPAVKLIHPG